MKFIAPHFYISKTQRNALLILVVVLLGLIFLHNNNTPEKSLPLDEKTMNRLQKSIDSLAKLNRKAPVIYPFNPNHLTDYRAYELGLDSESIDRLMAYRAAGNRFNTLDQFQTVAGIDDRFMATLTPYLIFPERKKWAVTQKVIYQKMGINNSEAADLRKVVGVGEKLSQRIIEYRKLLAGYSDMDQLYEVFGLDSSVVERIKMQFEVKVLPKINKAILDTVSYHDLMRLPYISAKDVQKIIRWRTENEGIATDDLRNIEGFDSLKIARITLYLQSL